MPEPKHQRFTSLLYLAQALPTLRERSDEAASLVEAAIVECAIAISGDRRPFREPLDLAAFLRYALDEMTAIDADSAALLDRAIRSLGDDAPRVGRPESRYIH